MIEVLFVNRIQIRHNLKFLYGAFYREIFCAARHNIIFLSIDRMNSKFHIIGNTNSLLRVVFDNNKTFCQIVIHQTRAAY